MRKYVIFFYILLLGFWANAQKYSIDIVTEDLPNRLAFYALNKNEKDLDVLLTIKGSNFRQSTGRPRYIRVPATSKVHMKTIVLMRGKKPSYSVEIKINDSLSSRSMVKEYEEIKIPPPKNIVVYITKSCLSCDSLVSALGSSKYTFSQFNIEEEASLSEQLQMSFGPEISLDSISTPILNIGGKLYTDLDSFEMVMKEVRKP